MRVAITHDYLNQFGGAERVLEAMVEAYPLADIHTLFYDEKGLEGRFKERVASTSPLDIPFIRKNHRAFIPLFPAFSSAKHIGKYDLVISNSVGFAKGFGMSAKKHVFYCNAALRYAWDPESHLVDFMPKFLMPFARVAAATLRAWDKRTGKRPDVIISNSGYTRNRIKRFYGRDSEILYPPVDTGAFYPEAGVEKKYYLAVGRLIPYKKFDIVIETFNRLNLPLLIVGGGREYERLKSLVVSSNIKFAGFVNNPADLRKIYNRSKAFLFPQIEDFGLVAAEALACGTPVIGFDAAGAREMIKDGLNGIFFDNQTVDDLENAVKRFEKMSFDLFRVSATAERFSKKNFIKRLKEICEN